jgi:hypothetical protein
MLHFIMSADKILPPVSRRSRAPNLRGSPGGELFHDRGSAQPFEKARFGQENPRETKPFPWKDLAGFGFGMARL